MEPKDTAPSIPGTDANQDGLVQLPPPSYSASTNTTNAEGSSGIYQAQPTGEGGSGYPPAGYPPQPTGYPPQLTGYPPQPTAYPPTGAFIPPSPTPTGGYPPPPNNPNSTVLYVVEDDPYTAAQRRNGGFPVAMICFIFGLCTWIGYLFGMCFLRSPDPRERWWARACAIMAVIWAIIIIFASIFGRPSYYY